jgi:signal transduction histidine kinase
VVSQQGATVHVNVRRDYAPAVPQVLIDRELCEQAFTNLLLNACEAMGDEGGDLRIRIRCNGVAASRQEVVVEIEDTGPGISPELKEQIFNPFFTTKKTGVGLGLAIVSKIVDAHRGSLQVTSDSGHGACFRLAFPIAESDAPKLDRQDLAVG